MEKQGQEIIDYEEFSKQINSASFFDLQKTINDFIQREKIERITRIRDVELDKICQMFFFGIRHTAFMNKGRKNYMTLSYDKLKISSMLEYTLINLSLRLSLSSKSRDELKEVITNMIKAEMKKFKDQDEDDI